MNWNVRQYRWLVIATSCGLLLLLSLSGLKWMHGRTAARASAQNLELCIRLAEEIQLLKELPAHNSLEGQTLQDLSQKIEQAARAAKIPGSAIVSISPQGGRKLGNSPLVAHPTNVRISEVSLQQLVRFLVELPEVGAGLKVTSLRLRAPRTSSPGQEKEVWVAELVLTYLAFSPEYAPPQPGEASKSRSL